MDNLTHFSVLLNESIDMLNIKPDGVYVDATLGGGGHSKAIVKNLTTGHLYCFEQDDYAIGKATENLKDYLDKITIIKSNFANLKEELNLLGVNKIDGIVYDLGVSSFQFDDEKRGFSYRNDARLDMRMDQSNPLSAYEVVNNYSFSELKRIFYEYGEERFAPSIASNICKAREIKPIETTFELVDIIKKSMPASVLRKEGHPAKQTFQAIRVEVNNELGVLEQSLNSACDILNVDGVIACITFQPLEDKIVKRIFKEHTTLDIPKDLPFIPDYMHIDFEMINNKPVLPSEHELELNNRSHSAKLRGLKRTRD